MPVPQLRASNSNSSHGLNRSSPNSLHCTALTRLYSVGRVIQPRSGPYRKHRFQQFHYCVTQLSHGPRGEHSIQVSPLVRVRNLLLSNGRCLRSHYLVTCLHATVIITVMQIFIWTMSQCTPKNRVGRTPVWQALPANFWWLPPCIDGPALRHSLGNAV
jgi:hypothetical protein